MFDLMSETFNRQTVVIMHSEKMFRQFKNQIIWTTESSAVLVV